MVFYKYIKLVICNRFFLIGFFYCVFLASFYYAIFYIFPTKVLMIFYMIYVIFYLSIYTKIVIFYLSIYTKILIIFFTCMKCLKFIYVCMRYLIILLFIQILTFYILIYTKTLFVGYLILKCLLIYIYMQYLIIFLYKKYMILYLYMQYLYMILYPNILIFYLFIFLKISDMKHRFKLKYSEFIDFFQKNPVNLDEVKPIPIVDAGINNVTCCYYYQVYIEQYFLVQYFICISILVGSLIFLVASFLSFKKVIPVKKTTYECGFDPYGEVRGDMFKIQYYVVGILFMLFEVELAFLLP
jgi:hypothetical protein